MKQKTKKIITTLAIIGTLGTTFTLHSQPSYSFFGLFNGVNTLVQNEILAGILGESVLTQLNTLAMKIQEKYEWLEKQEEEIKKMLKIKEINEILTKNKIREIVQKINEIREYENKAKNLLNDMHTKLENADKWFLNNLNTDTVWTDKEMKDAEQKIEEMKSAVDEARKTLNKKFKSSSGSGGYKSRDEEFKEIAKQLESAGKATTELESLQNISNMLGTTNQMISEMKDMMKNMSEITLSEKDVDDKEAKKLKKEKEADDKKKEELGEKWKKEATNNNSTIKIKFN